MIFHRRLKERVKEISSIKADIEKVIYEADSMLMNLHNIIPPFSGDSILNQLSKLKNRAFVEGIPFQEIIQERLKVYKKMQELLEDFIDSVYKNQPFGANENFSELSFELNEIKNKLFAARRAITSLVEDYNEKVAKYNGMLQSAWYSLTAELFNFKPYELYEIREEFKVRKEELDVEITFKDEKHEKIFEEFYNKELKLIVEPLEERRKSEKHNLFMWKIGLLSYLAIIGFTILLYSPEFAILFFIVGIIAYFIIIKLLSRGFEKEFKEQTTNIMNKIVKFIEPNLEYKPDNYIPIEVVNESMLFITKPSINRYSGSALISGTVGAISIEFSQVHALHEEVRTYTETRTYTDAFGNTRTETVTRTERVWYDVFRGVFFMADFNKSFTKKVILLPKGEKINLNNFKRIKLEDPAFENLFNTFGEDHIESRHILSPELMRRIVSLWERLRRMKAKGIRISFIDSRIFIAIDFDTNLFGFSSSNPIDYQSVATQYNRIKAFVDIVEDLQLNAK